MINLKKSNTYNQDLFIKLNTYDIDCLIKNIKHEILKYNINKLKYLNYEQQNQNNRKTSRNYNTQFSFDCEYDGNNYNNNDYDYKSIENFTFSSQNNNQIKNIQSNIIENKYNQSNGIEILQNEYNNANKSNDYEMDEFSVSINTIYNSKDYEQVQNKNQLNMSSQQSKNITDDNQFQNNNNSKKNSEQSYENNEKKVSQTHSDQCYEQNHTNKKQKVNKQKIRNHSKNVTYNQQFKKNEIYKYKVNKKLSTFDSVKFTELKPIKSKDLNQLDICLEDSIKPELLSTYLDENKVQKPIKVTMSSNSRFGLQRGRSKDAYVAVNHTNSKINAFMKNVLKKNDIESKVNSSYENEFMERSFLESVEMDDDNANLEQKKHSSLSKLLQFSDLNISKQSIKQSINKKFETIIKQDQFQNVILISDLEIQSTLNIFKPSDEIFIADNSQFTQLWNIIITTILLFYISIFPIENFSEKWLQSNHIQIKIQCYFEYVFVLDIFVNLFTAYRDRQGHIVKKLDDIMLNQLRSWFILDLISSVPITNLEYFGLLDTNSNFNVYLKTLKLPKYLRILKGIVNIFESRVSSSIDFDVIQSLTKMEQQRLSNVIKQFIIFFFMINSLSCQMISLTYECTNAIGCSNWFYPLMKTEQEQVLLRSDHPLNTQALELNSTYNEDAYRIYQNFIQNNRRQQLYQDAFYFVMQTVTTVGQGDIDTLNSEERMIRTVCMIFGTIIFSLLISNFLEQCIAETLNVYRKNEHEVMIEKMQAKYTITGDAKRYLNLLGDSVYTESLYEEYQFTKLLPSYMCDSVLKYIWKVYLNKIPLLQEESLNLFISLMSIAKFRRCVFDETVASEGNNICIIQSGRIGCFVANLRDQVQQEQLQQLGVGEEIGQQHQVNFDSLQNNQIQKCTVNSEMVEIKASEFLKMMTQSSLKGMNQVQRNLIDFFLEMQTMVSLQQSMLKLGLQIEQKWQKKMMIFLNINEVDILILNRMQEHFTDNTPKNLDNKVFKKQDLAGKWFTHILDNEIYKHIIQKAKTILPSIIDTEQELLIYFVTQFKGKKINRIKD